MNARSTKVVRCAIYTRVSTDQGLEQDFNSLDAQYDASQAYIRSQAHAGWSLLRAKYDDGGFSGGNTDRPALQRLLDDTGFAIGRVHGDILVPVADRWTKTPAVFDEWMTKKIQRITQHGWRAPWVEVYALAV